MLASVSIEDGHEVTFWEFTPGVVAVRESYRSEPGQQPAQLHALRDKSKSTLVEIYRAIHPNKQKVEPPPALLEADRRNAARQAAEESRPAPPVVEVGEGAEADDDVSSISPRTLRCAGCSPDHYNDDYGKQWFLDRFCSAPFPYRFCRTNKKWTQSGQHKSLLFSTCAMAADFDTGIEFEGWHQEWIGSFWLGWAGVGAWVGVHDFDMFVSPRDVQCWNYVGWGYRRSRMDGLSPCKRGHLAALEYR